MNECSESEDGKVWRRCGSEVKDVPNVAKRDFLRGAVLKDLVAESLIALRSGLLLDVFANGFEHEVGQLLGLVSAALNRLHIDKVSGLVTAGSGKPVVEGNTRVRGSTGRVLAVGLGRSVGA